MVAIAFLVNWPAIHGDEKESNLRHPKRQITSEMHPYKYWGDREREVYQLSTEQSAL